MKHKLAIATFLIVFIGLVAVVQSAKTAVLPSSSLPSPQQTNTAANWQNLPGPTGGSIAEETFNELK